MKFKKEILMGNNLKTNKMMNLDEYSDNYDYIIKEEKNQLFAIQESMSDLTFLEFAEKANNFKELYDLSIFEGIDDEELQSSIEQLRIEQLRNNHFIAFYENELLNENIASWFKNITSSATSSIKDLVSNVKNIFSKSFSGDIGSGVVRGFRKFSQTIADLKMGGITRFATFGIVNKWYHFKNKYLLGKYYTVTIDRFYNAYWEYIIRVKKRNKGVNSYEAMTILENYMATRYLMQYKKGEERRIFIINERWKRFYSDMTYDPNFLRLDEEWVNYYIKLFMKDLYNNGFDVGTFDVKRSDIFSLFDEYETLAGSIKEYRDLDRADFLSRVKTFKEILNRIEKQRKNGGYPSKGYVPRSDNELDFGDAEEFIFEFKIAHDNYKYINETILEATSRAADRYSGYISSDEHSRFIKYFMGKTNGFGEDPFKKDKDGNLDTSPWAGVGYYDEGKLIDFYAILGVDRKATPEQIKQGFKDQLKAWHPDIFANETDPKKLDIVKEMTRAIIFANNLFKNTENEGKVLYDELYDNTTKKGQAKSTLNQTTTSKVSGDTPASGGKTAKDLMKTLMNMVKDFFKKDGGAKSKPADNKDTDNKDTSNKTNDSRPTNNKNTSNNLIGTGNNENNGFIDELSYLILNEAEYGMFQNQIKGKGANNKFQDEVMDYVKVGAGVFGTLVFSPMILSVPVVLGANFIAARRKVAKIDIILKKYSDDLSDEQKEKYKEELKNASRDYVSSLNRLEKFKRDSAEKVLKLKEKYKDNPEKLKKILDEKAKIKERKFKTFKKRFIDTEKKSSTLNQHVKLN